MTVDEDVHNNFEKDFFLDTLFGMCAVLIKYESQYSICTEQGTQLMGNILFCCLYAY